jgi:hypothetical protein
MTPLFSLVHASSRPEMWRRAFVDWLERCDNPERVEYVLCVDFGREWDFREAAPWKSWGWGQFVVNRGRRCAVDAWNTAAAASTGQIIITVSDDYVPPEHWDRGIVGVLNAAPWGPLPGWDFNPEFVLDVDNQDNSAPLLPFSFISRAYYERLGYLFWPEYYGLGADNDFTEVARRDGVVIDARHLKFEHIHPDRGGRVPDSTDAWQHRPEAIEAQNRVFERRKAEGFPALSPEAAAKYYGFDLKATASKLPVPAR